MRRLLLPLSALLLSQALLLTGHGLLLTLLPLRAEVALFSANQIAFTGSSYYIGFVVGCLITPLIVRRVGHIRSFAVLCSAYSAVVLLFHTFPVFGPWLLLRFLVGVSIAGLFMIIESWLNDRSTSESRGTILSIYTIINLGMMVVGQQLLVLSEPSGSALFALAAVLLSVAIIPVSLTLSLAPAPLTAVRLNLVRVWHISHVGMAGAIVGGLVTGAFWAMGPVYARGIGLETAQLARFMSAVVLGGALFQLPLGRLSDHYDRRLVVFFAALFGAAASLALIVAPAASWWPLVLALCWGGGVMTLYAICLAHATDHAEGEEFVMVGTGILLTFGLSSAFGAPLAGFFMSLIGPPGLFLFSALVLAIFAIGISIRRRTHVLPVHDETGPFHLISGQGTAVAFELDPRVEEEAPATVGEKQAK